jgi:hypothetical protein
MADDRLTAALNSWNLPTMTGDFDYTITVSHDDGGGGLTNGNLRAPKQRSIPLPSQIEPPDIQLEGRRIYLHPAIQYTGELLDLCLELRHGISQLSSGLSSRQSNSLTDAATYPPLPSIAVVCALLPWPIIVHRSVTREFVTIGDLFEALCSTLQRDMLGSEESISLLFTHGTRPESQQRRKMSALLGERTYFMGLSHNDAQEESTFALHVTSL